MSSSVQTKIHRLTDITMDDSNPSKKYKQIAFDKDILIPDLPLDFALMCLARLSQRDRARCRCVSRAFLKALSDEDLMDRVCQHHGIPSKNTRVFLCLGKEDVYKFGMYVRSGLLWLTINPKTQELEVNKRDLPWFGTEALGRNIRLVAGPHPGQILIHGLINSNPRYGCPWRQMSHIWRLNMYTQNMIIESRSYRTGFAWANINSKVYVAAGRKFCDFDGETDTLLFNARCYYGTNHLYNVYGNYNDQVFDNYNDDDDDEDDDESYYDYSYDVDDNIGHGNWHKISHVIEPREACASFVMNGHFYLLGGMSDLNDDVDLEFLASGEFYDPDTDQWRLVPNMWPYIGDEEMPPVVAVVNNQLYGIKPNSIQIVVYNESLNSWTAFADLPERCSIYDEYRLLGVDDELWVFVYEGSKCIVFSCRPCPGNGRLIWKEFLIDLPQGHSLIDCTVIEV